MWGDYIVGKINISNEGKVLLSECRCGYNKYSKHLLNSAVSVAALSLIIPNTAMAQETAAEQEGQETQTNSAGSGAAIIVTGRKREERVLDVPVSIVAVSSAQIERQGIASAQDLAARLPGVGFDTAVNAIDFRPSIRGVQADRGRTNVGLLIDDIDVTSENLQFPGGGSLARMRLLDLERIEVVKGPQAALYGRSAFTGAINFITRRPDMDSTRVRGSLDANLENEFEGRVALSTPVAENVAIGATGYAFDERGSHRNTISGDYVGGSDGYGGSLSLLANLGEAFTAYGRVEYSNENIDPPASFVIAGRDVIDLDANGQAVTGRTQGFVFSGPVTDQPVAYDVNPRTGDDYSGAEIENFRAALIVDGDLGSVSVKSLTGYVNSKNSIFQDNDFITGRDPITGLTTGAFQEAQQSNEVTQISQEFRISSNSDSRFQWLVGGLYWHEAVDQIDQYDAALAFSPLSDQDILDFYTFAELQNPKFLSRDTDHLSFFAWTEYEMFDGLFVSAEARYTKEKITYGFRSEPGYQGFFGIIPAVGMGDPTYISFGSQSGVPESTIKEDSFTPRFVVSYRPSPDLNIYASVAKAVKPSGFQTSGSTGILTQTYDRETMWSYEAGVKSQLSSDLTASVSGFYMDYSDQQVGSLSIDNATGIISGIVENAGQSTVWGLELEAAWRPSSNFQLSAAYTYLNAKYNTFRIVSQSANPISEVGCAETTGTVPNACVLNYDGKRPSDSPKHSVSVSADYTHPLSADWDLTIQQNFRYVSDRFVTISNISTQEAYARVDMSIGISNDAVTALLYVDNLLNDDTVTDANSYLDFGNGFSPAVIAKRPDPRTVGMRILFDF